MYVILTEGLVRCPVESRFESGTVKNLGAQGEDGDGSSWGKRSADQCNQQGQGREAAGSGAC
jgi:hypothetical protein